MKANGEWVSNPKEWPDVTAVTFETPEDAQKMAEILNDMLLKINCLRTEVLQLRSEVRAIPPKNWTDLGP